MIIKLTFLLLAAALDVNSSKKFNNGGCENVVDTNENKFLLYCPGLDENVRIGKNYQHFFIECDTPAKFHFTIFPELNLTETHDVKFVNCLIPEEIASLGPVLSHFGIKRIETFTANNIGRSLQPHPFSNGFESLEYLKLAGSGISKLDENIFASLNNLVGLNLSDNTISVLPGNVFHSLVNLNTLELDQNEIPLLPKNIFARLLDLEILKLSHNKLKYIEEGMFTYQKQLSELHLDNNEISDLPRNIFSDLGTLEWLVLSNNRLKNLKVGIFRHQENLQELDLANNELAFLPRDIFSNLHKLETLELSNNKLDTLEEGIFKNQYELNLLYLHNNKLESLTKEMFTGLNVLTTLHLHNNSFKTIASNAFHNIPSLKDLQLGNYNTKFAIPNKVFAKNVKIIWLYLQRVRISNEFVLPTTELNDVQFEECEFEFISGKNVTNSTASSVNIFANQKGLGSLSLSNNEFTDLPDGIFDKLDELIYLNLSYNNLTNISGLYLKKLHALVIMSLNHNHIKSIESDAFESTKSLEKIDLSFNRLKYFDGNKSPFIYLEKLSSLNLSNNHLTTIPPDMQIMKNLNLLDLGFNKIASLKYDVVPNSEIYYTEYKPVVEDMRFKYKLLKIFLNDNLLECDCSMYQFLRGEEVVKNTIVKHLSEVCKQSKCGETTDIIWFQCHKECSCQLSSVGNIEIDCSHRRLSTYSHIEQIHSESLELYINNNNLTELPNLHRNERVIMIQASHNNIQYIKSENLSPTLRFLGISHNNIKSISADVVKVLNNHENLEIIFFANNPWRCDCSANSKELIAFFMKIMSMTDLQETKCRLPSGVGYELSSAVIKDVCSKEDTLTVLLIVTILSVIIGTLGILFYKYKQILMIWLYVHNIRLWCMDDDEFDKGKKFDAFISYSYLEEDLAITIVNELETGNPSFNLCVHRRDFIPGRLIKNSIAESMDNSCRTIVILSKNFLKSDWGLIEFNRAYDIGLAEKRMRLIIVIIGDIEDSEQLDPTIKSYLKTHTYIKWGDPWFWEKMRYAMPHRN